MFLIGEKTVAFAENMILLNVIVRHHKGKYMFTEKFRTDEMCQLKYLKSNEKSTKILVTRMSKNLSTILYWLI